MENNPKMRFKNEFSRLGSKINIFSSYLICMWMALPYFRVRAGVFLLLVFFVVWLATTDLRWLIKKWSLDMYFVLVFFITFVPYIITGNLKYGGFGSNAILINFPLFLIGIFINHYYMYYKKDYETLSKIALMTLVFFVIGSIQTSIGLILNPMASRIIATGIGHYEVEKLIFNQMGVGGFGYIYASCFILISVLYLAIKNNHNLGATKKFFVVITFLSLITMIFKASFAIALMIIISGFLLVLIVNNKKTLIISMVILVILFFTIPTNIVGNLFMNAANIFVDNDVMYEKLTELGISFLQHEESSQTNMRIDLYSLSFSGFLKHPFFGIYGPMGNSLDSIGGHSGWLDLLAYYGLFSGVPLFLIIYYNFKKQLSFYKKVNYYGYLIVIYFLFIVLGLINPVLYVYEIGFAIFTLVPIIPFLADVSINEKGKGKSLEEGRY